MFQADGNKIFQQKLHGATFDLLIKGETFIKILAIAIHFTLYQNYYTKTAFRQSRVYETKFCLD